MRLKHPSLFFSRREKNQIIEAICLAERETSGEIRVHLMRSFKTEPLKEAAEIFERLHMTKTKERNAILILFAVKSRQFCVLGDQGIHEKVPTDFWVHITDEMSHCFKQDRFADGLAAGIQEIGAHLKSYFPHCSDDVDELPNAISYSL